MEITKDAKVKVLSQVVRGVKSFALSGALVTTVRMMFPQIGMVGIIATALIGGVSFAVSDMAEQKAIEEASSNLIDTVDALKNGDVKFDVVVF